MGKYYWTREEEVNLLELVKKGITDPQILAKEFDRKPLAIERKLQRMGVVVSKWKFQKTLTTVPSSPNMFTH